MTRAGTPEDPWGDGAGRRGAVGTAERGRPAAAATARRAPGVYRRRRLAAAVALLVLLGGAGVGIRVLFWDSGLFRIERVTVTGAATVPVATVLETAAVPAGIPLASIDAQGIADRVAALPAVASVQVGRSWPHTVTVAVVERRAVATIGTSGGVQLVDAGGAVFPGPVAPGLPALTMTKAGPGDPATAAALAVLAALPPQLRPQVLTIGAAVAAPGAPGEVTIGLAGNREVLWGAPERAADKSAVLVPLLTQKGRVFDVRSPELPTVRR